MDTTIEGILSLINSLEDRFPGADEFTSSIRMNLGKLGEEMQEAKEVTLLHEAREAVFGGGAGDAPSGTICGATIKLVLSSVRKNRETLKKEAKKWAKPAGVSESSLEILLTMMDEWVPGPPREEEEELEKKHSFSLEQTQEELDKMDTGGVVGFDTSQIKPPD